MSEIALIVGQTFADVVIVIAFAATFWVLWDLFREILERMK